MTSTNPEDTGLSGRASTREDRSVHDEHSSSSPTIEQETVVERLKKRVSAATLQLDDPSWTPRRSHFESLRNYLSEAASLIEQLQAETSDLRRQRDNLEAAAGDRMKEWERYRKALEEIRDDPHAASYAEADKYSPRSYGEGQCDAAMRAARIARQALERKADV